MKCLPNSYCSSHAFRSLLSCPLGNRLAKIGVFVVLMLIAGVCFSRSFVEKDSAISQARKALKVAEASKNTGEIFAALKQLGEAFQSVRRYDSSIAYWQKGLNLAIATRQYTAELWLLRPMLNNTFFLLGNYTAAMEISANGLARAESINNRERVAHFKGVIGYILMKQNKFDAAQHYFADFLALAVELQDKMLESKAFFYLADLFTMQKKFNEAIGYVNQTLPILNSRDTTLNIYRNERLAFAYNKLAEIYGQMNNLPLSLQYNLRAISIGEQTLVNRYDLARYYINGGETYNRLKRYAQAVILLRKGLAISTELIYMESMRDAYEQLSFSFAALRNYDSAYACHLNFTHIRDSIVSENSQRELMEKETQLMLEKQQQAQAVVLNRQKRWKNISLGIAGISIIIAILLYQWYGLRQKNRFQAELNNKQQEIIRTTIQVADKERKRIAEDLHDTLGSILSATKLKLSAIEENAGTNSQEKENLKEVLALLDEAMLEMKNIAYNIMPATLSRLGVIAALQSLFNRIGSKSALHIHYTTYGFTGRLEEAMELSIYQVVLEAMNNIVKHAKAGNATIQLVRYNDHITITIEDDGQGFSATQETSHGNGLSNMQSRVKDHHGTIDIDSQPGNGTTIVIELPYS